MRKKVSPVSIEDLTTTGKVNGRLIRAGKLTLFGKKYQNIEKRSIKISTYEGIQIYNWEGEWAVDKSWQAHSVWKKYQNIEKEI